MAGLPIPSDKGVGGRASKVVRKTGNAVAAVDRDIEVIGPDGKRWPLRDVQEWLRDNPDDAPQFGNGSGPSFHKHEHGDTHIHVHAAPRAEPEPQLPEKTFGQQAAQFGASAALGAAKLPFQITLWVIKRAWESNEREKQRSHERELALIEATKQQNSGVNHPMFLLWGTIVTIIVLVILVSAPRGGYYGPWGWWDYPPPPPAYHRSYRDQ